ncbi:MAG: hypothetical protein JRI66_11280 [Deltaproteobacteria bacterium]|nr:hypothetical protein [Deltaproteobacteria bacterium]
MAATFYSQTLDLLRGYLGRMVLTVDYEGRPYWSAYIGSYMSLDPCGRYHHVLSPNGASARCERYWEALERAAEKLGGWIESGEGDPTDIYFCQSASIGDTVTVADLQDLDLQLVDRDYDVQAVKDYLGDIAQEYEAFLVQVEDGDYSQVWGLWNSVPHLGDEAVLIYMA